MKPIKGPGEFEAFETDLLGALGEVARKIIGETMAAADVDADDVAIEAEGKTLRRVIRSKKIYMTAAGEVEVERWLLDVRLRRAHEDGPSVVVRAETVLERPFRAAQGDALDLELAGDPSDAGGVAALELTLVARVALRAGAIVDVQLPPGVEADEALLGAVRGAAGVTHAEAREPGFLRIALATPMEPGVRWVVPLPLRYTVRGDLDGLGAVAYPTDAPETMTILAPRTIAIARRDDRQ